MKVILRSLIFASAIFPSVCYGYGTSSSSSPSFPTTTVPSTPPATPIQPVKTPSAPPGPNKNLKQGPRHSETFYRQAEEAPPTSTSLDTKEILSLIEAQLIAAQANEISKAYFQYTANMFRDATTLEEFQYFINSFPVFGMNKNALFGNIEFKKGVATIVGTLTATSGESRKVEYNFVKEGNQWKIAGIKLLRP